MSINMNKQSGFNLIESMVTLLILSIGLLGIASMVTNSVQTTDAAALHSQAVVIAYDMVDKIRANPSQAANYVTAYGAKKIVAPDCATNMCDSLQVAQKDLADWKTSLSDSLPSGDGQTVVTATDATVTVQWNNRGQVRNYSLVLAL